MSQHSSPIRFGILGTGRITRRLVADLQTSDSVQVTAIASRTADRARWYADQYGIAAAVEGYTQLLARDDVDAVYIALPPSLHAEWSIAAARAGKHLLCEKPLATDFAEAIAIDTACRAADIRWLDATGWLHHARTDAFAQWLSSGRFGKLGHITASVSFYQPFQSGEHRLQPGLGGGCLLDLGWYAGGLARFAAGQLPTAVFADAIVRDHVPFRLTAMLWFPDETTATLSCGYDTTTRKWFELAGSDASLICDDFTRPWPDKPARCWIHDAAGKVEQATFDGHQERSMVAKLIGDESLVSWQRQALDTQRLLEALTESIQTGGRVSLQPADAEALPCE